MTHGAPSRREPRRPTLRLALLLVPVALFSGCSHDVSVRRESDPLAAFAAYETFAWTAQSPSGPPRGAGVEDAGVLAQVQDEIESQFSRVGLVEVAPSEASLLVRHRLSIEDRIVPLDPYYSQDTIEKHEDGVLVIELIEASSRRVVWRGVGRQHLRLAARGAGLYKLRTFDRDGPRRWRVPEVVDATLAGSELMATSTSDRVNPGGEVREKARRDLYRRIDETVPDPEPRLPDPAEEDGQP